MPRTIADLAKLVRDLPEADADAIAAGRARESQLTKPPGSLGRLEDIAVWMAGWHAPRPPSAENVSVLIFAGNHEVAARGVSAYTAEVTAQMVANFAAGGAAINQICRAVGAELEVHALALDQPTQDFTRAPAMTEDEFVEAFSTGLDKVDGQADLICVGEMGIANTTSAAALCQAVLGDIDGGWVGPGTGVDSAGLERKRAALEAAAATHGAALEDPLEALRRVGGRELVAIAGAVIGARKARIPVLLDGFIACAAAAPLFALNRRALDHCLAAHCSAEPGHRHLLAKLGKVALLDLGLRLGEGSGAALAVGLVKAAVAVHRGMATFAEAGVSDA